MNPVTFSTLACPDWSIQTIVEKAVEFGYAGIEWRGGLQGHVQPAMPNSVKTALKKMTQEAGLITLAVTAYTSFISPDAEERQSNVEELRHYCELAAELGARYVRAFIGELPPDTELDPGLHGVISDCLSMASEYADSLDVRIAVEPHDDFARSSAVHPILEGSHPNLSVIWDIGNAFAAGEDPAEGFELLKDRLAYVQVKDGIRNQSSWQLCPLGQGQVPLNRAFQLLLSCGYQGALSVEWEYAWHLELDPPGTALPAALQHIQNILADIHLNRSPR